MKENINGVTVPARKYKQLIIFFLILNLLIIKLLIKKLNWMPTNTGSPMLTNDNGVSDEKNPQAKLFVLLFFFLYKIFIRKLIDISVKIKHHLYVDFPPIKYWLKRGDKKTNEKKIKIIFLLLLHLKIFNNLIEIKNNRKIDTKYSNVIKK